MSWTPEYVGKKPELNKPILIEGLPGVGSVGKIVVDFLIENVKAKKIVVFRSHQYPHAVFVNEQNLVQLPSIELFHKKIGTQDFLFLAGDVQPITESSCYEFSDSVLNLFQELNGNTLITLGGVALRHVPKNPRVFATGTDKETISHYVKGTVASDTLYGTVGPIIGVSGVLLGLAGQRSMHAVAFLAETYGHPLYIGVRGARCILDILTQKLGFTFPPEHMEKKILKLEGELLRSKEFIAFQRRSLPGASKKDTSYIG